MARVSGCQSVLPRAQGQQGQARQQLDPAYDEQGPIRQADRECRDQAPGRLGQQE
jgi:hypothetical protein